MPIRKKTPDSEVDRYIDQRMKLIVDAIIYNLSKVGEQVLNEARSTNSYKDRTGNLRSSLGYAIAVDGRIAVVGGFETVMNGAKGSTEGRAYVEKLARGFPDSIVLLVVAGMKYASYVSARGYNVLDTSELLAERLVPQMLKQIGF